MPSERCLQGRRSSSCTHSHLSMTTFPHSTTTRSAAGIRPRGPATARRAREVSPTRPPSARKCDSSRSMRTLPCSRTSSAVLRRALRDAIAAPHVKKRLDVVLVERGLAESRAQAQALVLAGRVRGYAKPGTPVAEDVELELVAPPQYVSRGAEKLVHALDVFAVDPRGRDCLDVGASTGGFTDVLLQRGAARVIALDVGYGQLHERLRADSRVVVLERTNARLVEELPFAPQIVTCDVSFISVRKALPPVLALAASGWQAVLLVKPQFEAVRSEA